VDVRTWAAKVFRITAEKKLSQLQITPGSSQYRTGVMAALNVVCALVTLRK
jgi:hypothetical protein